MPDLDDEAILRRASSMERSRAAAGRQQLERQERRDKQVVRIQSLVVTFVKKAAERGVRPSSRIALAYGSPARGCWHFPLSQRGDQCDFALVFPVGTILFFRDPGDGDYWVQRMPMDPAGRDCYDPDTLESVVDRLADAMLDALARGGCVPVKFHLDGQSAGLHGATVTEAWGESPAS